MMKKLLSGFFVFCLSSTLAISSIYSAPVDSKPQFAPRKKPLPQEPAQEAQNAVKNQEIVVADFEAKDLKNNLGGGSGSWNLDSNNPNSTIEITIAEGKGAGGVGNALKIQYNLNSAEPAQNGFWTTLMDFDATKYDHVQFDVRGDPESSFTDTFKIEIKKFKDDEHLEKIKGTAIIRGVSANWQTVQIPINQMTGLLNFYDPEVWKNPTLGRKDFDEFVIVFESRRVTKKTGTIFIDNIKFVNLGKSLPTAVDFPPRSVQKTPVWMEGVEYMKFLEKRLNGFPKRSRIRKKFPKNDNRFLKTIARDTWRYFDQIIDREHQLPIDTIQIGARKPVDADGFIGDYTNVTNVGIYLICLVSAHDLGFIDQKEAVRRINATLDTLDKLDHHSSKFLYNYYDTTTIERTSYFVSLVDSGWLDIGLYVAKQAFPKELKKRIEKLLAAHSYSFFYDPVEEQMFHGYYDNLGVYSDYHYGSFYTETRAISYLSIARGEVPKEHWFRTIRTFPESYSWQTQKPKQRLRKTMFGADYEGGYYEWKGIPFVPSWGGSCFEALMPAMVLNEKGLSPQGLGMNDQHHVNVTIDYTLNELKFPVWGMSPSSRPEGGYSEYGVKVLGSRGYPDGVVTPHASILALELAPQAVIRNLRELVKRYDIYGPYGFYDAVTVDTGLVARKYLSLDQGMILVALNNYLNDGAIRKRFHSDPVIKSSEQLLSEEKLFEISKVENEMTAKPVASIPVESKK